jgi:hypothetical protein
MKDQILTSTKNIIKYVNKNAYYLYVILKKFIESTNQTNSKKVIRGIMSKFIKLLAKIEVYCLDENNDKIDELYKETHLMNKTFVCIKNNITLDKKETKLVNSINTYLHCVVKLIRKIECLSEDTTDSFNIKKEYCEKYHEVEIECNSDDIYEDKKSKLCSNIINVCSDDTAICESVKTLRSLFEMFNLLKVVLIMLEKQFTEQLNNAYGNAASKQIDATDVDMINKLLDMYSSQFISILKKHCGKIFNKSSHTVHILVKTKKGEKVILCKIDNIKANIDTLDENKTFMIEVGETSGSCKFLTTEQTNQSAITTYKSNLNNIEQILKAIDNNQKLIVDYLDTIQNFIKYNLLK